MTPARVTDPFQVDRGPSVIIGEGHASCRLYRDGVRIASYGSVMMVPQDDQERRRWQRHYWQVLAQELNRCVAQLCAALTGPAMGLGVDGFRWPEQGSDWLASFVGPPKVDRFGRPDGRAALAHLTALAEQAAKELQALDQPTSSPGGPLP
jgi:hypothetical protein